MQVTVSVVLPIQITAVSSPDDGHLQVVASAAWPVRIDTAVLVGQEGKQGDPGPGGMQDLIYDPQGKKTDCFDAGNLSGNIDGGTFN